MLTFGFTFFFLNQGRIVQASLSEEEPETLYSDHFSSGIMNMVLNQYLLLLGEFELDNFDTKNNAWVWLIFFLATFISQVMIFNMLIAIMGDSYAKVTETQEQSAMKEKIRNLSDYIDAVEDDQINTRYLIVLKLESRDDEDNWQGILSAIKSTINNAVQELTHAFSKKYDSLTNEMRIISHHSKE